MRVCLLPLLLAAATLPPPAAAQNFAATGSRAAGMGGAFVAVADDASAIYWNPAGLAAGSFVSLVLDMGSAEATPDLHRAGARRSSWLFGLTTPALGLGYYRLHHRAALVPVLLVPTADAVSSRNLSFVGQVRLDSLVTHYAGVTVVQSLAQGIAVGTTLKFVRGIAGSQLVPADRPETALDGPAAELLGRASNAFDFDLGLMAYGGPLKVGLTLRNVLEPQFDTADADRRLGLERQARGGLSYAVAEGWMLAADADLLRSRDVFGDRRDVALGVEGRLARRAFVRSGARLNTIADASGERDRTYSIGGSYAVRGALFLDGHFTSGSDRAGREWGLAARFVY